MRNEFDQKNDKSSFSVQEDAPFSQARPRNKKHKTARRVLFFVLLGLCLLALLAFLLVTLLLNRVTRPALSPAAPELTASLSFTPTPTPFAQAAAPTAAPAATPTPTPLPLSEVYTQTLLSDEQYAQMAANNADSVNFRNILLVGIDRRGNSGNSSADTMMIATVDKTHGRLKLTSLLRDMLVEIPTQESYGKLNSAAAYGGMDLLMQTINKNFRLNIREYVLVDFNMFIEIIDRMGGVTVKMSAEEISAANDCIAGLNKQWGVEYLWDGFIFADAGNVKCTGKQALGYARIRHLDSDFKRTNRQYKVLTAVFAKFRSMSATKQYSLMYDLLPMVETNMQNDAILESALMALSVDTSGILQSHAPSDDSYESGRYERKAVLLTDITKNAWLIHQFIYENADQAEKAEVLTPGASLPPRTPRPTYGVPDANGNMIYYYGDGTLVPNQALIEPEDGELPGDGALLEPIQTPWQSVGSTIPDQNILPAQ